VLATSRQPLGVDGEVRYEVPPLPVPERDDGAGVYTSDAGRLLIERARAADPHFAVTGANAAALARICRQLDGMPLALELAAARLRAFDPERVADLLDDRFRLLVSNLRTAPARQQTLRAAVDWSYDLLTGEEQRLFRRLSVFAGGFSLEAAERVCGGPPLSPTTVLTIVGSLVDRSLLVAERQPEGGTRYRLLETLRAYGRARLEPGESTEVHLRQLAFLHDLVSTADSELHGPGQARWLEQLDAERDNLRAVLRWALTHGGADSAVRLIALLPTYWDLRSQFSESAVWLGEALGRSAELAPRLRAEVLAGAAQIALARGEHGEAVRLARRAVDDFGSVADELGAARARLLLGLAALYQGEYARAGEILDGCLAEFVRLGRSWERAAALGRLGHLARMQGDYPRARSRFEQALALCRELGDHGGTGWTMWQLGVLARYDAVPGEPADLRAARGRLRRGPRPLHHG
jgi:predicted ATPase